MDKKFDEAFKLMHKHGLVCFQDMHCPDTTLSIPNTIARLPKNAFRDCTFKAIVFEHTFEKVKLASYAFTNVRAEVYLPPSFSMEETCFYDVCGKIPWRILHCHPDARDCDFHPNALLHATPRSVCYISEDDKDGITPPLNVEITKYYPSTEKDAHNPYLN